ncbi:hypothetical protein DIPPA_08755 [Diplonema papillatum]|nr:hypothetical protein DIPPA_08755 [Diplonema papillatum]
MRPIANNAFPVMLAARNGHTGCLQLLLDEGAAVNQQSATHSTALGVAASLGRTECVRLLLAAGADPNARDGTGATALMRASGEVRPQCVELLVAGSDVNQRNHSGETAVRILAGKRSGGATVGLCVKILLAAGADPNVPDLHLVTPLMAAVLHPSEFVVTELVKAEADVDLARFEGSTALMIAAKRGFARHVQCLLAAGANANHASKDESTALMLCSAEGHAACTTLLIEHGADLDSVNNGKCSAAMQAANAGKAATLSLLVSAGADLSLRSAQRWTALQLAVGNEHLECADAILAGSVPAEEVREALDFAKSDAMRALLAAFLPCGDSPCEKLPIESRS